MHFRVPAIIGKPIIGNSGFARVFVVQTAEVRGSLQ